MFDLSQQMTAGGVDAVESRIRQIQAMIQSVDQAKARGQAPVSGHATAPTTPSFQTFIQGAVIPPSVMPMTPEVQGRQSQYQDLIQQTSQQFKVDPLLVEAVIRQESAFNPNAVSLAGARGLMQLMPETAKSLGVQNPFDPKENITGGVRLLSGLISKYHGNVPLALAAYNAGSGAVEKYQGVPPYQETQQYVRKILAAYLKAKSSQA